jgi:molecular chaperone DnaK (HSP70)
MSSPHYSIGIDLGTTNCAMAFTALDDPNACSEVFSIPQWVSIGHLAESTTLPSFLVLPTAEEAARLHGTAQDAGWICGRYARKRAAEVPGRVAHSAKSWLGYHAVDREAAFLPWGSEEIPAEQKLSPIRASGLLLNYLRGAWDARFPAVPFDAQAIVVTVPASFDAVAQRLTLQAASEAGFRSSVRLLEEPQAAFYRWLEAHADPTALWRELPEGGGNVLVVDIGGGTSDFSMFEISRQAGSSEPAIRRVAVSDHLLLGGDNIDLALAHLLEPRLAGKGETLAASQWQDLVARCRDLKERCLAGDGAQDEEFAISLPGRGSGLFAGTLTARVSRGELLAILLDGFFPECTADARPAEANAALKEWGLPYAPDSGITRYLADFLRDLPAVDAVLFNGGSLGPTVLRQRLQGQIAAWQAGHSPQILANPEPDLAVARGAARFGALHHHRAARIEAGAARSIYLEIQKGGRSSLMCILPRGAEAGVDYQITPAGMELRLNRPVRFQCYYSTRHDKDRSGMLVPLKAGDFHPLPPLQTTARLAAGTVPPTGNRLAVHLTARLTELGLLELECVSADAEIHQSWPLAFNLRADESSTAALETDPGVDPTALAAAKDRLVTIFSRHLDPADPLTAARLLKNLEALFEMPKSDWNLMLIRNLWGTLKRCIPCCANSVEHEEAWLILAGYFLRPGFGAELDPVRIDELWDAFAAAPRHPGKQVLLQRYILWRRIAGGLDRTRQQTILDAELPRLRQQRKPSAELVRLVGSLERVDQASKLELIELFLDRASELAGTGGYAEPYWVALGLLLNRTPLHAGPEAVVSADHVARAFDRLEELDWKQPGLAELFLRAGRVTDNRHLDLPRPLRKEIVRKLEKAGIPAHKTVRVEQFIPMDRSEQAALFGESLPPGLLLAGE